MRILLLLWLQILLTSPGRAAEHFNATAPPMARVHLQLDPLTRVIRGTMMVPGSVALEIPDWDHVLSQPDATAPNESATPSSDAGLFGPGLRVTQHSETQSPDTTTTTFSVNLESRNAYPTPLSSVQWALVGWHPIARALDGARLRFRYLLIWESPEALKPWWVYEKITCPPDVPAHAVCFDTQQPVDEIVGIIDPLAKATPLRLADGRPLLAVWRHETVERLLPSLSSAIDAMEDQLGKLPIPGLLLTETNHKISAYHPGLLPLLMPPQGMMRKLLGEWSHWLLWKSLENLTTQWWGATTEFAPGASLPKALSMHHTIRILEEYLPQQHNLLGGSSTLPLNLEWTYLQHTSTFATGVYLNGMDSSLLESNGIGRTSIEYVRLVIALRHAEKTLPGGCFGKSLAALWRYRLGKKQLSHIRNWYEELLEVDTCQELPGKQSIRTILEPWLATTDWWDPAVADTDDSQSDSIKVSVEQRGKLKLPVWTRIEGPNGQSSGQWTTPTDTPSTVTFSCSQQQIPCDNATAVVDPERFGFDANRFNNRSSFSPFRFFPGNARTLTDDAWTTLWTPYAMRPSGSPWEVGLAGIALRHVESTLRFAVGYAPEDNTPRYYFNYGNSSPRLGYWYNFSLYRTPLRNTEISSSISREFLLSDLGQVNLSAQTGYSYASIASIDSGNFPISLSFNGTLNGGAVGLNGDGQISYGTTFGPDPYDFTRIQGSASGWLSLGWWSSFSARLFTGNVTPTGNTPSYVFINPQDSGQGRIRLDARNQDALLSKELRALNIEWSLPFPFIGPTTDAFAIAGDQARSYAFADWGQARLLTSQRWEHLHAHGVGFRLPLGGSLGNGHTLVLAEFAVEAILRAKWPGTTRKQPSYLFHMQASM